MEDSDEPLDLEKEVRDDMVPGTESVSILELDALIKMPMPDVDPEEEAEKELQWQAMARMRVYNQEKSIEESDGELYEDLELILVQEGVEDVNMVGPSGAETS